MGLEPREAAAAPVAPCVRLVAGEFIAKCTRAHERDTRSGLLAAQCVLATTGREHADPDERLKRARCIDECYAVTCALDYASAVIPANTFVCDNTSPINSLLRVAISSGFVRLAASV